MYIEHGAYSRPTNDNISIWRYMSLARYAELLERKALYFCRLDKLANDPFEGVLPRANLEHSEAQLARSLHARGTTEPDEIREARAQMKKQFLDFFARQRRYSAVSCWHMADVESEAMWRLYSARNAGVAVRSTFARLRDSFSATKDSVRLGTIKYVEDYDADIVQGAAFELPIVLKRQSFQHEAELRAVIQKPATPHSTKILEFQGAPWRGGKHVRIDLDTLIDRLHDEIWV